MTRSHHDQPTDCERRLREWSRSEPAIDEAQLRRNLMERTADRPRRRAPMVLAVAAVSVLAVLIGFESTRKPAAPAGDVSEIIRETGDNVILVLREGRGPIYVVTEGANRQEGVRR